MWQRFTERARKIVFYAQEEAQKFGEGYVSTEHLLLGLIRESDTVACRVLQRLGVSLEQVRDEVVPLLGKREGQPSQDMTLTPRAKRVIDLAYDEARNLNNNYIGSEHLLLGLCREGEGLAGRALSKLGVELERLRRETMRLQDENGTPRHAMPADTDAPRRQAPSLSAAMLAIRQRRIGPDLMALLLLAESTPEFIEQLKGLGFTDVQLMAAIETEILRGPAGPLPGDATLNEIWPEGPVTAGRLFGEIARHPSTFTRRVLENLGVTTEMVQSTFGLTEQAG